MSNCYVRHELLASALLLIMNKDEYKLNEEVKPPGDYIRKPMQADEMYL